MDQNELDEELKQDRVIDPSQLDVEAVRQADCFYKWAERSVIAKGKVEDLEFQLDLLEAKLQMKCRDDPGMFGIEGDRTTETAIKSAVKCSDKYVEATKKLQAARLTAALAAQAVAAMEQRKRMIEVLVTLHGQEYFAGPSVPRSLVDAWNTHCKKAEATVNSRQSSVARRRVVRED